MIAKSPQFREAFSTASRPRWSSTLLRSRSPLTAYAPPESETHPPPDRQTRSMADCISAVASPSQTAICSSRHATAFPAGYQRGSARRLSPWCDGIIRLFCATNASITGEPGCAIDGHNSFSETGEEEYRGVHGICADFSTNIVLRGVELRNTGNWATRRIPSAT